MLCNQYHAHSRHHVGPHATVTMMSRNKTEMSWEMALAVPTRGPKFESQHPCKKLGTTVCPGNSNTEEMGPGGSRGAHWASSLA